MQLSPLWAELHPCISPIAIVRMPCWNHTSAYLPTCKFHSLNPTFSAHATIPVASAGNRNSGMSGKGWIEGMELASREVSARMVPARHAHYCNWGYTWMQLSPQRAELH